VNREPTANRGAILRAAPKAVGAAWVTTLCSSLAREGRSVEGGWPGTFVEARALVSRQLRIELACCEMREPSGDELAAAATATYEHARTAWLAIERRTRTRARERP
jgi:hypothetical protein